MSVDFSKEKLLCMMVLDDELAERFSAKAGEAFWRGFILEDRETHKIRAAFRFSYTDGNKHWFGLKSSGNKSREETIAELDSKIKMVMQMGCITWGVSVEESMDAVTCYYPPDDEGDPQRTIDWLLERDLIEVSTQTLEEFEGGDKHVN